MLRSGFFNSKNHDKLYYNSDISRIFNSLIIDGIFQNIGGKFIARPGSGMQVIIPSGMAYFNSTWLFNDTDYIVNLNAAPIQTGFSRIDGVFLKMGPEDDITDERENTIYYMAGTPASQNQQRPVPTVDHGEQYIPICYILVGANVTEITAANITNMVGTNSAPFLSGILTTISAGELLAQWEAQFNDWMASNNSDLQEWETQKKNDFDEWFANIVYILDGDVAGHLQNEIDALSDDITAINNKLKSDNNQNFQFAYDSASQKYGYKINGTFYPFKTAHTGTYVASSRGAALDMGEDHENRYVDTNSVPNSNSGTQTISEVYNSGNGYDMGATNAKRYIKTSGLMKTPTATKSITANGNNQDVLNYSKVNVAVPNTVTKQYTGGSNQSKTSATYGTLDTGNSASKNVHFFFCYCKPYTGQTGTGYIYFQASIDNSSWVNLSSQSITKSNAELIAPKTYDANNTTYRYFRVIVDFSNMTDGAVSINITSIQ